MKRVVFTALVAGFVLLAASAAHADNVFIGLGANGGAPGVVAASATGAASLPPSLIVGWTVSATVFGTPPAGPEPNLEGFTVDASDTSGGISSLQIYITEGSLSSPTGIHTIINRTTTNMQLSRITSVT